MAFAYAPYLIANLRHGLELGIKPWLAPADAFSELVNCHLDQGVLYKRNGRAAFGALGRNDVELLTAGSGNLLSGLNPGFEDGVLAPWALTETAPADATPTVTSGSAHRGIYKLGVTVANPGAVSGDLALSSPQITMANGLLYLFKLAGRSTGADSRMVKVRIYQGAATIFEETLELFPVAWGWTEYSLVFTAGGIVNPEACVFSLEFGGMGNSPFHLDDLSLEVIGWSGNLVNLPIAPGDLVIGGGAEVFTDDGAGNLTGDQGGVGEVDYATGACWLEFADPPAAGAAVRATYNREPSAFPCMGMFNYSTSGGSQDLLAWDTKRVHRLNEGIGQFDDIAGADLFSGNDDEFIWMVNWLNRGFMTNGRDRIYVYDGLSLIPLTIDLSEPPDGVNDLNSAYLIFPYKDRLVFLRTSEGGNFYPARARWTKVGKYDESDPLAYVDAPTDKWIVGAAFIRNELVVFFERGIWLLRYTGDSRQPFRWVRVDPNEGLIPKMGLIDFNNEAVGLGPTQLIGTDGVEIYNLDDKIPNLVLSMNQEALQYCYATALDELRQMWMSYPSVGQPVPDRILVLNYEEKSFATYQLPHMVTGYYQESEDLTWDEIEETWDEMERSWDDRTLQGGYPVVLGGDSQGKIWKLNSGGSDNGEPIEMIALTGRLNPFIKKGRQARLGWVEFLVNRDPLCELTVEYFLDHETSPYLAETLPLDDGSGSEQIWVRSYVGCEAQFHRLRLYNKAVNQSIVIHAIMPYFAEAGRLH
ncbi:MAG: hypothetical protein C4567_05200 [Deltaproteobacteria bacterium]|nr:MAG: hypothetical protein C4567_05200 [Deltaproteobacteria bacterium]